MKWLFEARSATEDSEIIDAFLCHHFGLFLTRLALDSSRCLELP